MKWGLAIGQILSSRAVVDKIEIPEKYYNKLDSSLDELERWSSLFRDFEIDKPHTWASTGFSFMRKISVARSTGHRQPTQGEIFKFVKSKKLEKLENLHALQFWNSICTAYYEKSEPLIQTDSGMLRVIRLPKIEDDLFFYEKNKDTDDEVEIKFIPFLPAWGEEPEEGKTETRRQKIHRVVADMYWSNRSIIQLDNQDAVAYNDIQFDKRRYEGVLTCLYKQLDTFRDAGIRRSLLFQGEPGTGKSTLAFNLAKKISKRTIVLTQNFVSWVGDHQWKFLMDQLRPEMIIIDDIDRCSGVLENKLYLMEDRFCKVPFIIMTSNHYNRLPDAFKRPGRIDQIIEMEKPPEKIRYEVVRALADQEGVKVPDSKMPVLDKIHQQYPGSHIVELLRRCKAEGWDYQIPSYDLTFKDLDKKIIEEWNGEERTELDGAGSYDNVKSGDSSELTQPGMEMIQKVIDPES